MNLEIMLNGSYDVFKQRNGDISIIWSNAGMHTTIGKHGAESVREIWEKDLFYRYSKKTVLSSEDIVAVGKIHGYLQWEDIEEYIKYRKKGKTYINSGIECSIDWEWEREAEDVRTVTKGQAEYFCNIKIQD